MRRERGENAQIDTYVSGGVERKINSRFRVGRKFFHLDYALGTQLECSCWSYSASLIERTARLSSPILPLRSEQNSHSRSSSCVRIALCAPLALPSSAHKTPRRKRKEKTHVAHENDGMSRCAKLRGA